MKIYFFSRQTWGTCYTVMAENKDRAIQVIFDHVLSKNWDKDNWYEEEIDLNNKIIKNKKQLLKTFKIEEYDAEKILETEYS